MNTNLTEIAFIMDRSGSMETIANDAIGGFNSFLKSQLAESGAAKLTLILFDDQYEILCEGLELASVKPLNSKTYIPRGSTALLDAIGRTIDSIGKRLSNSKEEDKPGKVIVAILTDGEENASKYYCNEEISKMISHQRDTYSWQFIFLAANQDAIASASILSISADDAFNFEATAKGVVTMSKCLSEEVSRRRQM